MAAPTQHEVPSGIVITPTRGNVLVERDPVPTGPAGPLLRADQLLGRRCDTGAHVLIDPSRAIAFRHVDFTGGRKQATSGEFLLVPEAAIIATVAQAPTEPAPPPPTPRKRREAPPVETADQGAAREAAEAAAREALEEAAARADT